MARKVESIEKCSELMGIGRLPNNWRILKFKDVLFEKTRNGIYKPKKYHGKGIKIVNMKELFAFPRIKDQPMNRLELDSSEMEKFILEPGDLLFARRSLVAEGAGKCSLVCSISEPVTFESSIIRARPDKNKVNSEYLFYLFNSPFGRYLMDTILRQVAVSGITGSDLMKLKIPIPSIYEQDKIAKILSDFDKKLELNYKINNILEIISQSVFKNWFIDFEFPDEEGKPYKSNDGELIYSDEIDKEIPIGWKIKPIDEIANYLNGLAMQKYPPEGDEYIPVIKIREMKQGITKNTDKASKNIPEEYIIEDGDVIFSWSGSLNVCIWGHGKGALNQHLFKVTSEKFPKWFYYNWIKHYLPKFRHIASGKATTMGHIKRNHLTEAKVVVPPEKIINKLDRMLNPLLEKYINNLVESRNLTKIRDLLLPKLMSGKIRVKVPEVEAKP